MHSEDSYWFGNITCPEINNVFFSSEFIDGSTTAGIEETEDYKDGVPSIDGTNKFIFVPPGIYDATTVIDIYGDNITICGAGSSSVIKGKTIVFHGKNCTLKNLVIDLCGETTVGFKFETTSEYCTLENVIVRNVDNLAGQIYGDNNSVISCNIYNCSLGINDYTGNTIRSVVFTDVSNYGIFCSDDGFYGGNVFHSCNGIDAIEHQCVISDNVFYSGTIYRGENATIFDNYGYTTENGGAETSVDDGDTITHGLVSTPTYVLVTTNTSGVIASVTSIGSSTFTVALKNHDGTAATNVTVYWGAYYIS